jgi:glycine/D-amino acid oxidase-like deaminating enzyme
MPRRRGWSAHSNYRFSVAARLDEAVRLDSPDGGARLRITVDGKAVEGVAGETVAATLLAAGHLQFSSAQGGAPRGPFCGMGICHDCLVTIDGIPSQRACMTKLRDGMAVARQSTAAVPWKPAASVGNTAAATESACDVLIVGAGPGGLATAVACGRDLAVRVIDDRPEAGGQYYKQPVSGHGDRLARAGAALIAQVRAAGATITSGATVWGAFRAADGTLEIGVLSADAAELVRPRLLVVATGAYEPSLVVPGWTLPGVMTVGACQTFVRAYGVVPGQRIVVAGNGPLGLQLACEILRRGGQVVAVAEAAPAPWRRPAAAARCARASPGLMLQGLRYLAELRRRRVPMLYRHVLAGIAGDGRTEAAMLASVGTDGMPLPGGSQTWPCDVVCMGYGFAPSNELPRLLGCTHRAAAFGVGLEVVRDAAGETSQPDVLVVGEAGGFAGAQVALAQGRLAGARVREKLGFSAAAGGAAHRVLRRHRAFQAALRGLFAAAEPGLALADRDTVVCRCESITLGTLQAAIARHALVDVGMLKRATRAGMGRCQGRYCGASLDALLNPGQAAEELRRFAPQMPLRPVRAGALAAEAPEWRGHRRTVLPRHPPPPSATLPIEAADTVVVGGGIVGLSTAWYLGRAGHDVVVLDRGEPAAEASGGNAGSLHVQLLSFDFAATPGATESQAARTLPLQRDAVALWQTIEAELGTSFEFRRTGGLMVAETPDELAVLRAKVELERRCGIEVDLIGAHALYGMEPALKPGLLGAAWCPQEGKINPLLANQAMLDAARGAGARLLRRTEVLAIRREPSGFVLTTQSGAIRAGRVVNAAGAWAARIAAMLGSKIPVFGAPLQMIVTEPAAAGLTRLLAHAARHLTMKQAAAGGFIIGGGWTAALDPVHFHPRPLRESLAGNLWVACRLLPSLGALQVIRSWAAMNIDIDGAPILGEDPAVPNLFHAVGANGYTLGPLLGQVTAQLILGREPGRDIAGFGVQRFGGADGLAAG